MATTQEDRKLFVKAFRGMWCQILFDRSPHPAYVAEHMDYVKLPITLMWRTMDADNRRRMKEYWKRWSMEDFFEEMMSEEAYDYKYLTIQEYNRKWMATVP